MSTKAFESGYTWIIVVPPDPSPTLSNSTTIEALENTEENSDDPEWAVAGDIQMEYSSG
jgi:hypothetical protein